MDPQPRHAAIRRGFRDNDIDAAVLRSLTDEGLKDLGIASVGRQRRLLGAIAGPKPKWQSGCDRAILGWHALGGSRAATADDDVLRSRRLDRTLHYLREVIAAYHRGVAEFDRFVAKRIIDALSSLGTQHLLVP
jgi:hypothetical protein